MASNCRFELNVTCYTTVWADWHEEKVNMTDSSNNCPSVENLKSLIDGHLAEDESLSVQAHIDQCVACQRQLASLVAGTESWDATVGRIRESEREFQDAMFSDAMKRIKAQETPHAGGNASGTSADPLDYLSPSDQPGSIGRLGSYEVTQVIGQGGMGIVLKAYDPSLHRVVAVKILAPYLAHNSHARKRFVREAQAIAAVSHDHVITIHAIDETAEQPKIVMQFVPGQSLQQKIDAEGSLDLKEILRIGMQTASGLAAAHAQGLVHRDIKPSNILLENGIQRVKLTDFGLARAVDDASLTQSGVIAGTPQYMAPEQANGDAVDHRADLFSLGSVMYSMCVGHSPFRASTTMGVLKRVCHDPPRPIQELNPDIPIWLSRIILKLLAKRPDDRFQSAREVAELLERWLAHVQQPMATPIPPVAPVQKSASGPGSFVMSRPSWLPHQVVWPLSLQMRGAIALIVIMMLLTAGLSPIEIIIFALMLWGSIFACRQIAPWIFTWWNNRPASSSQGASAWFQGTKRFDILSGKTELFASLIRSAKSGAAKLVSRVQSIQLWETPPGRRNLLFAGWCLASWIDLMCVFLWFSSFQPNAVLVLVPLSLMMSAVSLVVSHAILRQQNAQVAARGALIGMLPLSPGTIVRVPLSLATLIWLQSSEVKEVFAMIAWPESDLGRSIRSWRSWLAKWAVTGVRVSIWTFVCSVLLTTAYVFYQVPYGPSEFSVLDVYTGQLKGTAEILGEEQIPLTMQATGRGPATGLFPPTTTYRRRELLIHIGNKQTHEVTIENVIHDKLTGAEITEADCIAWFNAYLKSPSDSYGKDFFRMLTDLRDNGGFSTNSLPAPLPNPATVIDYFSQWSQSLHTRLINPPGVLRLSRLLDPELFVPGSRSRAVLIAECHSSYPWMMGWGLVAFCGWLYGVWQIVSRRHFRRGVTAAMLPATV